MKVIVRSWGAALVAGLLTLGAGASAAHAQFLPPRAPLPAINPAFNVAPGLQQYSNVYNAAVLGQTIRQIPPWAFGYNPYPSPVVSAAPVVPSIPYIPPAYSSPSLSTYPGLVSPSASPGTATLSTNPYGYDSSLSTNPGYPASSYSGYGYPAYGEDPVAGFLRGTSDVVRAQGQYFKDIESARMTRAQADMTLIDKRRKLIDEAAYERGLLPTSEQLRQDQIRRDLDRARHEPPISDIISGKSLNDLLHHLTGDPAVGRGPNVPIDEDVLKHINVTSPNNDNASLGLLKDDGKLQWPSALSGKEFEEARTNLSRRLEDVVGDLKFSNPVQQGKLNDLKKYLGDLRSQVQKSELSPSDYIAAQGYLDQVDAALQALSDSNVVANFNHKFNAKNVAELVDGMKGLDFAPAAPGDEWAYKALHDALVAYDYGASPQGSSPPPAPKP
jgi:hypothetical protein